MMEHCNGMMYTVKSGDTLYSISMKYKVPLALLLRVNPYVDVYNLQAGETICVPVKGNDTCCGDPYGGTFRSWQRDEQRNTGSEGQMENRMEESAGQGQMRSRMEQENTEREQMRNRMEQENTEREQMRNRMEQENTEREQMRNRMEQENIEREQMRNRMERENTEREQMRSRMEERNTNMEPMGCCMQEKKSMEMEQMEEGVMEYTTREGDTLEKILGVKSIPLIAGITLYRQK